MSFSVPSLRSLLPLLLILATVAEVAAQNEPVDELTYQAERGDASAQNNLANAYELGQGVRKDEVEAVSWYRKAAQQGLAIAQNNLGNAYLLGQGVPKDDNEAVRWYRNAAEQGNVYAQYNLGNAYAAGDGVPKDEAEALRWYRKSAEQGFYEARDVLVKIAKRDAGAKSLRYLAERGDAAAQNNLANAYELGQGVRKDEAEAVRWYRRSADQGLAIAQNSLGNAYELGQGVAKDENWTRPLAICSSMPGTSPLPSTPHPSRRYTSSIAGWESFRIATR